MSGVTAREERLVTAATALLDALVDLKERGFFRDRRPGDPVLTAQLGPLSVAWVALAEAVGAVARDARAVSLPPVSEADVGRVGALDRLAAEPAGRTVEAVWQVTPGGVTRADLVALAAPVMDVVRLLLRQRLEGQPPTTPAPGLWSGTAPAAEYAELTAVAAEVIGWMLAVRQAAPDLASAEQAGG